jgi:TorA maturation chaperone TorD
MAENWPPTDHRIWPGICYVKPYVSLSNTFQQSGPVGVADIPESSRVSVPDDEDRLRGNVYALLGRLLAGPPDEDLLGTLRGIAPEPDDDSLLAASWQMLATAAARTAPNELRHEYDTVFVGLGRGEVVPYGSWYLTGFLMEKPLAELRSDLRRLGIERQPGVHEPEDHAGALCDTMALLITTGERLTLDRQHEFFARHLEPWISRFFRDLQSAPSARFYRAVGQLGEQFIGVEAQAFRVAIPAAGAAKPS